MLVSKIHTLQQESEAISLAWPEEWPFKGPGGAYATTLNSWIGAEIYRHIKPAGVVWPTPAYLESDFPGLAEKIIAADQYVKSVLLSTAVATPSFGI